MGMSRKFVGTGLSPSAPASWGSGPNAFGLSVAPVGVSPTESESDVVPPVLNVFRTSLMFEDCNPPIQPAGRARLSQPATPRTHRAHSDCCGTAPCQMYHRETFDNPLSLNDPVQPGRQNVPSGTPEINQGQRTWKAIPITYSVPQGSPFSAPVGAASL